MAAVTEGKTKARLDAVRGYMEARKAGDTGDKLLTYFADSTVLVDKDGKEHKGSTDIRTYFKANVVQPSWIGEPEMVADNVATARFKYFKYFKGTFTFADNTDKFIRVAVVGDGVLY